MNKTVNSPAYASGCLPFTTCLNALQDVRYITIRHGLPVLPLRNKVWLGNYNVKRHAFNFIARFHHKPQQNEFGGYRRARIYNKEFIVEYDRNRILQK